MKKWASVLLTYALIETVSKDHTNMQVDTSA